MRDEGEVLDVLKQTAQTAAGTIRQTLTRAKLWAAQLEAGDTPAKLQRIQQLVQGGGD